MTTEEKQLLFKDICARLPYGIYCQIKYKRKNKIFEECKQLDGTFFNSIECLFRSESGAEYSTDYKPYLRSMSSMTEEEKEDVKPLFKLVWTDDNKRLLVVRQNKMAEYLDYIYSHHLDFRGLIPMGLALEAPEGMYK
jgi:hypothetical protein